MSVTVGTLNVSLRGTPAWMAPELLLGVQPSCASDVYSFGIVLYEIFSRLEPYANEPMIEVIAEVADLSLSPPRRPWGCCRPPAALCPPAFADLMVRCTQNDPELRPTFAEIVRDLRGLDVPSIIESMMTRAADNKHSEDLLHNVFPPRVAKALKEGRVVEPEHYDWCDSIDIVSCSLPSASPPSISNSEPNVPSMVAVSLVSFRMWWDLQTYPGPWLPKRS